MRPTMVDLVSDPPRLLFPDGVVVEVPRSVARREALRIVRAGLPPEPAGGGRVAAQPDPQVLLATRVTDVTPPAPVAGETADGGAKPDPVVGTAVSVRNPARRHPPIVCPAGACDICDDRRDLAYATPEDHL